MTDPPYPYEALDAAQDCSTLEISEEFTALQTDGAQLYCPGRFPGVNTPALQCPRVSGALREDIW